MVSSSNASGGGTLTELQWMVLEAFFEREGAFFLTGGAALVGFHLVAGEWEKSDFSNALCSSRKRM